MFGFELRRRAPVAALGLFALAGCMPPSQPRYVEPRTDQPHALVEFVRRHTSQPGPFRADVVHINGQDVAVGAQSETQIRVATDANHWFTSTRYWHNETRRSLELVYYTEYETDYCAYRDYKGNCQTGTRAVRKSRLENVTNVVEVTDAACDASGSYQLETGRRYRLTFTFEAAGTCSLACRELTQSAEATECQRWTPPVASAVAVSASTSSSTEGAPGASPREKTSRPLATVGGVTLAAGGVGLGLGLLAGLYANARRAEVERRVRAV